MPTSISTSTASSTSAAAAAALSSATLRAWSTHTPIRARRASAASRRCLAASTTWFDSSTSLTPPSTSATASFTFWLHTPTAPWAICSRARLGHLWLLACGRGTARVPAVISCSLAMLRSAASRSNSSAGVSTSATASPMRAGG